MNQPVPFKYNDEARKAIMSELPLADDALIARLESLMQSHISRSEIYKAMPSDRKFRERLDKLACLAEEMMKLASCEGNREMAQAFWTMALANKRGLIPSWRWKRQYRVWKAVNLVASYLCPIAHNNAVNSASYINNKTKIIDTLRNKMQEEFLRSLADIYIEITKTKPGRSKSTIGPFIRFAHIAMKPVFFDEIPSIDSLNERWFRMNYDVRFNR